MTVTYLLKIIFILKYIFLGPRVISYNTRTKLKPRQCKLSFSLRTYLLGS